MRWWSPITFFSLRKLTCWSLKQPSSKRIMAYEHVTTIHELHMECPTPKDSGDVAKSICQNLHHPDEASKVLRLWFWLRRCCYLISARENWSEMRTVLGEMGGEHHPQVLVTLGKTNGLTLRFCVFSWGLTMVDQKLIQNTNSQTLQVPMVCISNIVFYHMRLILLPTFTSFCFGLFGGSRYLCLFVSKSHPGCEGCCVNMVCPQIQRFSTPLSKSESINWKWLPYVWTNPMIWFCLKIGYTSRRNAIPLLQWTKKWRVCFL